VNTPALPAVVVALEVAQERFTQSVVP